MRRGHFLFLIVSQQDENLQVTELSCRLHRVGNAPAAELLQFISFHMLGIEIKLVDSLPFHKPAVHCSCCAARTPASQPRNLPLGEDSSEEAIQGSRQTWESRGGRRHSRSSGKAILRFNPKMMLFPLTLLHCLKMLWLPRCLSDLPEHILHPFPELHLLAIQIKLIRLVVLAEGASCNGG